MAKFAIITIPFFGHINTTISVGQELINRGHSVAWITAKPMRGLNIPNKGHFFITNQENKEVEILLEKVKNGKNRAGLKGVRYITEDVLIPLNKLMYEGLVGIVEGYKPDLIIHDEQTYAGAICAYQLGIPYATTYSVPSGIFESLEISPLKNWYFSGLLALQKSLGVEYEGIISHSKKLGLVFCPKNFNNLQDLMPSQKFVGPCIDIARIHAANFDFSLIQKEKKHILVSIGTLLDGEAERFFNIIVEDFKDSPYQIIVSAKPHLFRNWPSNFIVQENLPQLEILKQVDAVITHGGANTVCESVGMGKPMVVLPMAFDQYHLAEQIQESHIGLRLKYKRLSPNDMKNACDEVLNPANIYMQNVKILAESFKSGGGARQAANYLENLIVQ